jgi:hypothetical protein
MRKSDIAIGTLAGLLLLFGAQKSHGHGDAGHCAPRHDAVLNAPAVSLQTATAASQRRC